MAERFRISVHSNGYYCVSIPNYHGGEVVDAEVYDRDCCHQYEHGRHVERERTMQLIGGVRMDLQTGADADALDRLVECIVSEPLVDLRDTCSTDPSTNPAVNVADSIVRHYAAELTERGDEGRDILNYTDYIKGQKDGAIEVRTALNSLLSTPTPKTPDTYTQEELNAVMASHNEHADDRVATARADLAHKVLETVRGEQLREHLDNESDVGYRNAINDVHVALRDLFVKEGIELQPKEVTT